MNTIDDLFEGALVIGVPTLTSQMASKMPGHQDGQNQGDHCATSS